ncbi:hypothetical protein CRE_25253 [Caenorhabditis remanei]|uniref:Uncharacterized protein n=1 Tax=Caenorhabditis remanei TaxID=31234 RepID=E3LNA0_CAERE|nr:hypothetical protein CRE_28330 [Caenorhabditis remanei]EFP09231.1 hypothetical protein CRE_25253 [Caenorhabditis remanei]
MKKNLLSDITKFAGIVFDKVTHMPNNMEKLRNSESPQLVESQFVQEEEVFDDIHLATWTSSGIQLENENDFGC